MKDETEAHQRTPGIFKRHQSKRETKEELSAPSVIYLALNRSIKFSIGTEKTQELRSNANLQRLNNPIFTLTTLNLNSIPPSTLCNYKSGITFESV